MDETALTEMITINHEAARVPHLLRGDGEWFVKADGIVPGTLIVGNGKENKCVRADEIEPLPGFFFQSPEREIVPAYK